ncbi:DNA-binding winged helix-turn-helix (wHTH) protein [Silvibacterium bohemicum]|uniref:DNA-binding winged helix-turn-helix (WHTH) protein n=2 Tax=Silvibacterium bohemicum TaxID=1577686 RepID=A0A841JNT8_9BACT|nr:DNA-binding winged helix-turn-helix (wHTH) protein [Silvibacterium bohemicum]
MLIELAGDIASREEIRRKLWSDDTAVDFDHSINAAVRTLRRTLGDSASRPKYIETLARRGYRLMVPVEKITDGRIKDNSHASGGRQETEGLLDEKSAPKRHMWKWTFVAALVLIAAAGMLVFGRYQGAMRLSANEVFLLSCPIFCVSCIVTVRRR